MPRVALRSKAMMPAMGLGTWKLKQDTAGVVAYALSQGYRLIDTSSDYGTQAGVGEGVRQSEVGRDELYVTTKVEETDDAYHRALSNLEDLQFDYVDLLLIHRPPEQGVGEELWRGLQRAREEQLVRDIGVSNYSIDLMERLTEVTGERPAVNQIEWSPFGHSQAMQEYCENHQIVIQAYSPLTRAERLDNSQLQEMASKHGKSPAQIVLRWNMQNGVVPIPKANQKEHLVENIMILDFELSEEDMQTLSGLNEHYSALGGLSYLCSHDE